MERLKSLVPDDLRRVVGNGTSDNLLSTSTSLLRLFLDLQQFHEMVRELVDPKATRCGKNKDAALELKQRGNQFYLSGDQNEALSCYSQALRVAPMDIDHMGKTLVATLYVNRAFVFYKMGLLLECVRDCNRALKISPRYAKAWYKRGKGNGSLGNYEDAICDFTIAKDLEPSLGGKRQIDNELKIISDRRQTTSTSVKQYVNKFTKSDLVSSVPDQVKLQGVTTPEKGRGMAAQYDIPQASLVHVEEPYTVIILKHCRETHCHYCLNELPADILPCPSCAIPVYCSECCQVRAGGQVSTVDRKKHGIYKYFSKNLAEYIAGITLSNDSYSEVEHFHEHQHECQGVNWPAILPRDVILAGRVLVKSIEQRGVSLEVSNLSETLELSHSYSKMPPESKLELHVYAIVLLWCLRHSYSSELSITGVSVSQIIILLSQIKINSMAIVRMKSHDIYHPANQSTIYSYEEGVQTTTVEQVRVGQALYIAGSVFNHSCQPNIHAYFLSRKLLVCTTEFVAAGCALELSYGPEVGKWDRKERHRFLEDDYFFQCQCHGCADVNMSDLVLNGFRCTNLNCSGVVLDNCVLCFEEQKLDHISSVAETSGGGQHLQVSRTTNDISKVAHLLFEGKNDSLHIDPGSCLNCGCHRDMKSSHAALNNAWIYIRRLQGSVASKEISVTALSDALRSLDLLKSILHPYNKGIAEAEDITAQASCLVGDLQAARKHCKASIEILEKLYGPNHIVIGYELVKLSSIQLSLGDFTAASSINRLGLIFSQYYGSHASIMVPYLKYLKEDACRFIT